MLLLLVVLGSIVSLVIAGVCRSDRPKKIKSIMIGCVCISIVIMVVSCVMFIILDCSATYTTVERYEIPLQSVQNFKVKETESYCTWDDGYGETYIVLKSNVKASESDSVKLYKTITTEHYTEVVSFLLYLGIVKEWNSSIEYEIECPASSIIVSQKSNREIKIE